MTPAPIHRLPAPLEAAAQHLKLAAREAAERSIEALGLAALAASNAFQRDGLLGAQFELNRKSAVFVLTFNDAFDTRMLKELAPREGDTGPRSTTAQAWDALSLVEDKEVEAQISAERFGMEIAHACEWELRELGAYVGSLLTRVGGDPDRNPLRPEIVGHALIKGVEAVSERSEVRQVLGAEMQRSLGPLLRQAYGEIVAKLRDAGVQPMGLTLRQGPRGAGGGPGASRAGAFDDSAAGPASRAGGWSPSAGASTHGSTHGSGPGRAGSRWDGRHDSRHDSRYGSQYGSRYASGSGGGSMGQVDPALMSLIRRLAHVDIAEPAGDGWGQGGYGGGGGEGDVGRGGGGGGGYALPNLIRAHRDELRQASTGGLDHMVIDVVGSLFDQILADPKVPPQMARQIARLQLPVLRTALGDPSFFTSRRHPVRRFVNRIASLGAAFEDFGDTQAQRVLAKVRALVHEVVEGDFDQIALYEGKLDALERFVAEAGREALQAQGGAADLIAAKEDELRLRQLYAQRLEGELQGLAAPEFLREFIGRVWSQVIVKAAGQHGEGDVRTQRLRELGRALFMSVQPKATPMQRKEFLAALPQLMQGLTEGMNLIGWPEPKRRDFFGKLMPAHAEALKAGGVRTLDLNLMARQVEGALDKPLPSVAELQALKANPASLPVLTEAIDDAIAGPAFSAEEAQRVGLLDEAAVDWDGTVDIDLGAVDAAAGTAGDPPVDAGASTDAPVLPGLPATSGPVEPTQGAALADAVQIGFAYQMHLEGAWQKVRLAHVSEGRSFFVFTRGSRHKQTISLTRRMLQRLCDGGRLRAFENADLIERATARARRQLAAVGSTGVATR
jgi:hypothetical protein